MSDWSGEDGDRWAADAAHYTRMLAGFERALTEGAGYDPGERVLDVGCGCGDVSLAAGRAVGAEGEVLGVDLSASMLAVAAARAEAAGLGHVGFTVADATTHRPEPDGFDALVSRFGVMFFDDPLAAFTNLHSLLAPEGRLAFVCWADMAQNDWLVVPGAAAAEVLGVPPLGDPTAPGPMAFADAERVAAILTGAGFSDIAAEPARATLVLGDDAAQAADFLRTTGIGRAMFAGADPATADRALARVTSALEPYETPDGVALDGTAWLVTASA